MSRFECPKCGGGFPELPPEKECPWCGQPCNGESDRPTVEQDVGNVDLDSLTRDMTDPRPFNEQVENVVDGPRPEGEHD